MCIDIDFICTNKIFKGIILLTLAQVKSTCTFINWFIMVFLPTLPSLCCSIKSMMISYLRHNRGIYKRNFNVQVTKWKSEMSLSELCFDYLHLELTNGSCMWISYDTIGTRLIHS